ncbi:MAG TPA: lamin tail domain-containing protein, partial [Candidatus Krumholzibacterium sp.]|nr:lamin tail domain-containing protein [Candidatus Krumholzibacterium sp.]
MMCRYIRSISIFFLSLQIIFNAQDLYASVVINEVYYDHPGSDGGREFIELLNTGDRPVPLEGWSLVSVDGNTGSVSLLWSAPGGALIEPSGYLLAGGDDVVSSLEYRLSGSIENGPDCVALMEGGRTVDRVGYGVIELQGLCEGDCAQDVPAGRSLARKPDGRDTDDNRSDFVPAVPSPGLPNFYERDLAAERPSGYLLVCPGSAAYIPISLVNRGLAGIEDAVTVALLGEDGTRLSSLDAEVCLSPGEISEISLYLPGTKYFPEELTIAFDLPGDMNGANDSLNVITAVSPGDIVINEIMPRPSPDGSEWVELFNRSEKWIDLSGWVLSDRSGSSGTIPVTATPLSPGSFLVLADDPDAFFSIHRSGPVAVVSLEGRWPRLNDGGEVADVLVLTDGEGWLVDQIEYGGIYGEE